MSIRLSINRVTVELRVFVAHTRKVCGLDGERATNNCLIRADFQLVLSVVLNGGQADGARTFNGGITMNQELKDLLHAS